MGDQRPRQAALVHEQAQAAVEAARVARERSRQIASEIRVRRCRDRTVPPDMDAATEATLRAALEHEPAC